MNMKRLVQGIALLVSGVSPAISTAQSGPDGGDMDCEIMFCLAAGFGHSACMPAYREMIDNVTPWPIKPPFGICTLSNADGTPAGPMDTTTPNMQYLASTRVLWWEYRKSTRNNDSEYHWKLSSCLIDNQTCTTLSAGRSSNSGPRFPIISENGNQLSPTRQARRAFAIEYVDYEGEAYQTEWTTY